MTACDVDGCERPRHVGRLCVGHYGLVPLRMVDARHDDVTARVKGADSQHDRAQLEYVNRLRAGR